MQGAACGVLLTFAAPAALMLAVLLAPAAATAVAEQGPYRGTTRAVLLCCAAASLSSVWRLLMEGDRWNVALDHLANPSELVLAWGAGACAWAACQVLPVVMRTAWDIREAARAQRIREQLALCREEWDLRVEE